MAMNKSDLVAAVADKLGTPMNRTASAVHGVFEAMTQALARGERIEIRGFGSWSARRYNARNGRNPKTGKRIKVPAKRLPYFKAGKKISDCIMAAWQQEQDQPDR